MFLWPTLGCTKYLQSNTLCSPTAIWSLHQITVCWLLTLHAHLNLTVTWTFMKPLKCRWFLHWKHVKTCVFYVVLYMKACVQQPNYFTAVTNVFPVLTYLPNGRGNHSHPEGIYCMISSSVTTQETWALHPLSLTVLAHTAMLGASIWSPLKMPNKCSCTWITASLFIPLRAFTR